MRVPSARLDANKTIFVGALHGMLSSEGLAKVINDLFDNVVYSGIDTDKYKYPIGKLFFVNLYASNAFKKRRKSFLCIYFSSY